MIYAAIADLISHLHDEFQDIPVERRRELKALADELRKRRDAGQRIDLTFICTHNSRRSHLAQLWGKVAAVHYGVPDVHSYSGGTEATAFAPGAVAAVKRAGFRVELSTEGENPIYHVHFAETLPATTHFSKVYDAPPNPQRDYFAIMTCSSADEACPVVQGSALRVPLTYEDPKAFDGTPREAEAYDERLRQIGRELLYCFSRV